MDAKHALKSEERVWAALAHGSALFFIFGPVIPVIIWFTQSKKSVYAAFHAMQAMGYQVLSFWLWMLVGPIVVMSFPIVAILIGGFSSNPDGLDAIFPVMMLGILGVFFGIFGLYFLLGILGAIFCLAGRDFRYPVLGNWLARYVGYVPAAGAPLSEEGEDRFLSAIGHSTAILVLWGMVTPLVVWMTQKDRSRLLRFQSMQAVIYQGVGALVYLAGTAVYTLFYFGMMMIFMTSDFSSNSPMVGGAALLLLISSLCIGILFLVLGPVYQFLAFLAAVRLLRGHDYRYPILGGLLARRMEREEQALMEAPR